MTSLCRNCSRRDITIQAHDETNTRRPKGQQAKKSALIEALVAKPRAHLAHSEAPSALEAWSLIQDLQS